MEEIPPDHPRAESLIIRKRLALAFQQGIVVPEGLAAHGRGEAFDYLLGERTIPPAISAAKAGIALMLLAEKSVISVNGNAAALVPAELVELAKLTRSELEVNLFHPSKEREQKIARLLVESGANQVLGIEPEYETTIPELSSARRKVDRRGIAQADVVLVPLEDGDRTEALKRMGKKVIAIDLNPLSRTSLSADVTIVDNIVRALPLMCKLARELPKDKEYLQEIVRAFNNKENLSQCLRTIVRRLEELAGGSHLSQEPSR